jgi:hypothetical protein
MGARAGIVAFIGLFMDFRGQKIFEKKLARSMLSDKLPVPSPVKRRRVDERVR